MLWRDFAPFVTPFVIGCPMPVLVHHARLVSIDWCRKTLCWQRDLDAEVLSGTSHEFDMQPLSVQSSIVKVLAVAVNGRERDLLTARDGQKFVRSQHPGDFCFTPDNLTLHVYPLEPEGTEVVVTAALAPALNGSSGLEDEIALQHADDIAKGIVASIMRVPGQDFSNPAQAAIEQGMYEARRTTIAAKVGRGLSAAKTRTQPGYL